MATTKRTSAATLAPPRSVAARVRRFIRDYDLVRPGARVLVGVSGGPDSTCLLLTLAALRRSLRFELCAAYFDHGLRGPSAAERERRFLRSLTETLAVPLQCGAGDLRGHAQARRLSLEEAARELRYRFLARAARKARCDAVAVGHTQDDQAETVLLHLLRGSGLRGLAGMAPSAPWPLPSRGDTPRLVRPLLCLSRADTERACREAGVVPLRDPTNRSRAHLRNRIRLELLPLLRRYNPRIGEALVRFATTAAADVEFLEELAAAALPASRGADGTVRLERRRLLALPPALQAHAVRLAASRLLGDARALSERHLRAVLRAAAGPTGGRLDLPRGLRLQVERGAITLTKRPPSPPRPLPDGARPLPVPGTVRFGLWRIEVQLLARRPAARSLVADSYVAYLDADACGPRLSLRRRRPGDRFQPLGLARSKKLQDFFVDAHVPRAERDAVPLVCAERGIAWIVGRRLAEWAKVTAASRRVLRLRASRGAA